MKARPGFLTLGTLLGLSILAATVGARSALAQSLYGFGPVSGENDFFGFLIEPETGAFRRLATIGNRNFTSLPAFDSRGRRLFMLERKSAPDFIPGLLTLDLDSGEVTSEAAALISGFLEYSDLTQTLYGIGTSSGSNILFLVAMDTQTHFWTDVAYFQETSVWTVALDSAGQRLFFLGGTPQGPKLFVVQLQSGSASSVPIVDVDAPHFSLHFDSGGRVLYGVGGLAGESASSIFSVDPVSASLTRLAPLSDGHVFTSAFDPGRQRLYFTTHPPETLSTFDVRTGVITAVAIERCCPALFVAGGAGVAVPTLGRIPAVLLAAVLALLGFRFVRGMA